MSQVKVTIEGKISTFGGPGDSGVSPSEGLALFSKADLGKPIAGELFLPHQPVGTTGMARRLDPRAKYIAMRWDYKELSRETLRNLSLNITANGKSISGVRPVDWGPHINTARVMDISPYVATVLSLKTDQEATISYSYDLRKRPLSSRKTNVRSNATAGKHGRGRGRTCPPCNLGKPRKVLAKKKPAKSKVQKRRRKTAKACVGEVSKD